MRIGFMMPFDRERINFARENDFGSVELQVKEGNGYFPGDPDWEARADAVKAAFDGAALRVSCIAGFYVNHLDPRHAERGRALVRGTIQLARRMGVDVVAGFAGRLVGQPLDESLPEFARLWGEHARFAEDHGVRIAFEHCPMGRFHTPAEGTNLICTPEMWERCFDAVPSEALGLEWDPSHLICLFVEPVPTIRRFGARIYHVHAKDARVDREILARHGFWHRGAIDHCFAGLGDTDWAQAIKELRRVGYAGDLNIEGWHDAVYRDHPEGPRLEDEGLLISRRYLAQFLPPFRQIGG